MLGRPSADRTRSASGVGVNRRRENTPQLHANRLGVQAWKVRLTASPAGSNTPACALNLFRRALSAPATCELGPRCGDGVVSPEEECDNGLNLDSYKTSDQACAPGCKTPGFCGDGIVNTSFGEVCDDGVNDNSYNGCSPTCQLGPRCGDGIKQSPPETCDDGNQINGDSCDFQCKMEPPRMVK